MTKPGRNIPIDKPNIITGCIFPYFFKRHALAFKCTMVLAGEQVAGELLAFNFKRSDFFYYFSSGEQVILISV